MGITQEEADLIESEFMSSFPQKGDYSKESARKVVAAWNHLVRVMARENNMSCRLGVESIDWQIGNWANDTTMTAYNARLYEDVIKVDEQILKINWGHNTDQFHENAKREIADAYADLGNVEKCLQLYESYLREDPLWGWARIGYFRQLREQGDSRFEPTLDELYQRIQAGKDFRDKSSLFSEMGDEYEELGNRERAEFLYELEKDEKRRERDKEWFERKRPKKPDVPLPKPRKLYPNDPCPCGSGKKYKKCCGRG